MAREFYEEIKLSLYAFHGVLPRLAKKETASITFEEDKVELGIEKGRYFFTEHFCVDGTCDCRRALIGVFDESGEHRASLSYAWETPSFYSKWMGGDKEFGEQTAGVSLYPAQPQGKGYMAFKDIFENAIRKDPEYAEKIARHYKQFKEKLAFSPKLRKKIEKKLLH